MIRSHKLVTWSCFVIILLLTLFLCWQDSNDSFRLTTEVCEIVQTALSAVGIRMKYTPSFYLITRKVGHCLIFIVLSASCYLAFNDSVKCHQNVVAWSLIFSTMVAVSAECMQHFLDGREARIYDVVIDMLGVVIGNFITSKLQPRIKSRFNHSRKTETA